MPAKYRLIAESLRQSILDETYPANTTLPTEQKLCHIFDASRQTVRQALKCLVDAGMIERRQGSGSWVLPHGIPRATPRRTIAIITTYISDYIFPDLLREAEDVFSSNNCKTLLYATSNLVSNERKILSDLLEERKLDGVMVEATKSALPNPNLDLYRKLQEQKIPLVFFNSSYSDLPAVSILDDNYNGSRILVNYLASKGHRQIAGIFKADDLQGHQRYAGFIDGLRDCQLPMQDSQVLWFSTEEKQNMKPLDPIWQSHLEPLLENCSAVVCYNDEVANYLIQYLMLHHIPVPDRIAVVSFDDSLYSALSPRKITSLSHGRYNAGQAAAHALVQLMSGQDAVSQYLPWYLSEKESS